MRRDADRRCQRPTPCAVAEQYPVIKACAAGRGAARRGGHPKSPACAGTDRADGVDSWGAPAGDYAEIRLRLRRWGGGGRRNVHCPPFQCASPAGAVVVAGDVGEPIEAHREVLAVEFHDCAGGHGAAVGELQLEHAPSARASPGTAHQDAAAVGRHHLDLGVGEPPHRAAAAAGSTLRRLTSKERRYGTSAMPLASVVATGWLSKYTVTLGMPPTSTVAKLSCDGARGVQLAVHERQRRRSAVRFWALSPRCGRRSPASRDRHRSGACTGPCSCRRCPPRGDSRRRRRAAGSSAASGPAPLRARAARLS